jgi:hypothetical protein
MRLKYDGEASCEFRGAAMPGGCFIIFAADQARTR